MTADGRSSTPEEPVEAAVTTCPGCGFTGHPYAVSICDSDHEMGLTPRRVPDDASSQAPS